MNRKALVVYHYFAHYRYNILKELSDDTNLEFFFAADYKDDNVVKLVSDDFTPPKKKVFLRNFWIGPFLWQSGLIKQILLSKRFDTYILLGDYKFLSSWVFLFISKLTNRKVYLWTHGLLNDEKGIKWLVRKLMYSLSDGLLLYGDRAKMLLDDKGIDYKKCHVIYNSVNELDLGNRDNKKTAINLGMKYDLIFSGRLLESRTLELLANAVSQLKGEGLNVNVLVVGDGAYKHNFIKLLEKLNIESSFELKGAVYDSILMSEYFAYSKALIMPSDIGLAAVHSLSHYTPVITHDDASKHKPEAECLKEGVTGFFFNYDSSVSLANAIKKLVDSDVYTELFFDECTTTISTKYVPSKQRELIVSAVNE